MTTWALMAPGPSASAADAEKVRQAGIPIGAIGCSFQLAPWADFIAASDAAWWRKYPEAITLKGEKFAMVSMPDIERVRIDQLGSICNSGVLALEVAKTKGATRILLLGFDMHGSHFFGQYTNGLRNTNPTQRQTHMQQFAQWGRMNKGIEAINCTSGSALECFPRASLDDCLAKLAIHGAGSTCRV